MQTEILTTNTRMYRKEMRSGVAGCSAEEHRLGMVRDEARAWQWRPHGCEQLTHGLLKKYRPGAEQNGV